VATALRSVLGRIAVATPVIMVFVASGVSDARGGPFAAIAPLLGSTAVLAIGPLSLLVFHPVLLNQFGIDGGGVARQVLAPLSERSVVMGKVLGGAALVGVALLPAFVAAALLNPTTPPLLWPAAVLGAGAACLLVVPAGLWLSILFPKPVDLSRLGSKSKPHAVATVGGLAIVLVALGGVQLSAAFGLLAAGPAGALLAETLLFVLAAAIAAPLLVLAERSLGARRDALLLALR
jgi:hypothetical protein